jgi:peptidoglycan LD-endopeptidase LytH
MPQLIEILKKTTFECVIPYELQHGPSIRLDMNDTYWADAFKCDVKTLTQKTETLLREAHAVLAIGRYAEDRAQLYARSDLFRDITGELRSVHLGVDLMVPSGTPVFSPCQAVVHSMKDNDRMGDFGATIVLTHKIEGCSFFTLYGHLSRASLQGIKEGQLISAGEQIGEVGNSEENGQWPPHLHFQIIRDMGDWRGGFPGVALASEAAYYLDLCPDPGLMLRL